MGALAAPDLVSRPIGERNSTMLRMRLWDNGDPRAFIPGSALDSCVLTLYSEHGDQDIINSRDEVDVLSLVDESGLLEYSLTEADMAVQDPTLTVEYHRILVEYRWTPAGTPSLGQQRKGYEIRLPVRNVYAVPGTGSP